MQILTKFDFTFSKSYSTKFRLFLPLGDFLFLGAYLAHPIETGVKARLLGEEKSAAEKLCMSFMFFMVGKPMGSLRVLKTENGVETLLWEKTGDQGFKWHEGSVNITSKSPFKV